MSGVSKRTVLHNGVRKTITELSNECGIDGRTLIRRIFKLGWTVDKAIKEKVVYSLVPKYKGKRSIKVVVRKLRYRFKRRIPYYFKLPDPHKTINTFTYKTRHETSIQQLKIYLGPLYNESHIKTFGGCHIPCL